MNQEREQERNYIVHSPAPEMWTTKRETSIEDNLSVLRLQITYRLVLGGILAVVGILLIVIIMLWFLAGLPIVATLSLATAAIGVIGTLDGVAIGHLLGSMGKEQAEKRADKDLALLLEYLQKSDKSHSTSSQSIRNGTQPQV